MPAHSYRDETGQKLDAIPSKCQIPGRAAPVTIGERIERSQGRATMRIALLLLLILVTFGALWLKIGAFALIVAPAIGLFVLLALTPLVVEAAGYEV